MLSSIGSYSAATSLSFQASAVSTTATSASGLNSVSLTNSSASFSLENSFSSYSARPAVSIPLERGHGHHDHGHHHGHHHKVKEDVESKISGFMQPFSETFEKLQDIMKTAMESLSELVENTSLDAAAIQIDIRFGRLEESYSGAGGQYSGVFNSFAIEVSVVTADIDFDPNNAAVINMTGAKVELSSEQMIVGHETGIYKREANPLENFPGFDSEKAEQDKKIIEFLKENRKMFEGLNKQDRKAVKHMFHDLFHDHRHNMKIDA